MEYENVLIPYDFSDYAETAIQRSVEIFGVHHITILHVATPNELPINANLKNNYIVNNSSFEKKLEEKKQFIEGQGISAKILIEPSHHLLIAQTVLDIAKRINASLIVIGARGKGRVKEFLLGSVSHDVVRNAHQHVLLMHLKKGEIDNTKIDNTKCPLLFSSVLCPMDLSKPSEETVHSLLEFSLRSKVILLHVIRSSESRRHLDLLIKRANTRLSAIKDTLEQKGITVETIIKTGDPVLISCTLAEKEDVSLILLSRFGRFNYAKNIPIGSTAEAITLHSTRPVLIRFPRIDLEVIVRKLLDDEFTLAEKVWVHSHQQKADQEKDRIFGIFVEGEIAGVARCKRHPDGYEVDGVFVLPVFRDRGYARRLMQILIDTCGKDVLYMHATLELVTFYRTFGFKPIPESELPPSILDRFNFALGNMQGSDVCPMRRIPNQ
ncbi:MAG: GNAT family N-acetyltransferase [Methanoregulaceae archaeon]|jgi:nucleotide-binding universal stress UspA family protein/N-acetylglutamate synthase-like GNAT family acetyltransferase